ncbi:radical SAM protein [Methanofollis sp. UBA420]|jgi:wyosine [tRNA(Phe)-imidazoG37] synthetase (radical SAM superfamily)|uniref:radical SAM protein n=1 Tax=Methanofollis sp. UBA420 TaxID=1915514 RepID=UPI00316AC01D
MPYRHLFGPVPSRRLGISLGIDLVPLKTCSYNCVYCECGPTTALTTERKEYVPTGDVIAELRSYLSTSPRLDYVTLAGSGEPTLHTGIGEIIQVVKSEFPAYRVAVLTNGSFLPDPAVRRALLDADLVVPTLNAVSDPIFRKICRPHRSLSPETLIDGLIAFRKSFSGEIWLEVFIVPGVNDDDAEVRKIADAVREIRPDRVQLNTLDRPGAAAWVRPADHRTLDHIASLITAAPVDIVGGLVSRHEIDSFHPESADTILALVRRRPCTLDDLARATGMHRNEVGKYLQYLLENHLIEAKRAERGIFFLSVS